MSSASPAVYSDPVRSLHRSPSRSRRRSSSGQFLSRSQSIYDWTVLVLIALPPWLGVWLFGGVRWWSVGPLMSVAFLATALTALRYLREPPGLSGRLPPGFLLLAVFVGYGFMLIPRSAVPYDAYVESLKVASFLGAYWVWSELSGWQGRWRWIVAGFLLVVTVMAWYAIIQHVQGERGVLNLVRPTDYGMRASGAYFCPNHFANLLDMTVPFAVAVAASPAAGLPLRLLAGYSALVALPPLYLTQSRSGWIGVLAGLVVTISLLGLRRGVRRFLLFLFLAPVVLAVAGFLVWMLSPMVQNRVAEALAGNIRLQLWHDTWLMIREQPWLGWGPLSYRWIYPHFWHHMDSYLDPQYAHNDYLHTWAEYGLVGLLLVVGAALVGAGTMIRRLLRMESERAFTLVVGFLGALVATAAHAGFDYNFHIYGNVQMLVMMAGLAAGALAHAEPGQPLLPSARWARGLAATAVLPLLLMVLSVRAVAAYGYALKADFDLDEYQIESAREGYERALRLEADYWPAYLGLGHLWGGQAFWNRDPETRAEQVAQAEAAYRKVLSLNAWETEAQFGLSRLYNLKGDPEAALKVLQDVLEQMPYHRDFLNQLGLQLRQMGRLEEALAAFQRARRFGPHELTDLNIQTLTKRLERKFWEDRAAKAAAEADAPSGTPVPAPEPAP